MAVFTSTAEAEKYIGEVFEDSFTVPATRDTLVKSGLVMRINLSDPEGLVVCDMPNQKVYRGTDAAAVEPNVTLTMSSDTANKFWQGKVSLPLALARGTVKLSGSKVKVLGLLPAAKPIQRMYIEKLTKQGRNDLIA